MSDYWGHEDWEAAYPSGYECCASGSCEVCGGVQGVVRAAAAEAERRDPDGAR